MTERKALRINKNGKPKTSVTIYKIKHSKKAKRKAQIQNKIASNYGIKTNKNPRSRAICCALVTCVILIFIGIGLTVN